MLAQLEFIKSQTVDNAEIQDACQCLVEKLQINKMRVEDGLIQEAIRDLLGEGGHFFEPTAVEEANKLQKNLANLIEKVCTEETAPALTTMAAKYDGLRALIAKMKVEHQPVALLLLAIQCLRLFKADLMEVEVSQVN